MTEDKWGNRDAASQFRARMDRATSDREMAEWIREGTDKSDTARAFALPVFILTICVIAMIKRGGPPPSVVLACGAFLIACLISLFSRKS
ncbi:hypothetical protein BH11PLA2_BH11PLA2_38390 [soil metagenome]